MKPMAPFWSSVQARSTNRDETEWEALAIAALHGQLGFYQLGLSILELLLMLVFSGKVLKITEFEIGAFLDMSKVP